MPQITSNFILRSKLPNFERDSFANGTAMDNVNSSHMDEGHISYNEEDRKHYVFHSIDGNGNDLDLDERWTPLSTILANEINSITSIQDIWVVGEGKGAGLEGLSDNLAIGTVGLGKLVFDADTAQLYVNVYDPSKTNQPHDYLEGKTGWFRPVCDSNLYIDEKLKDYGYVSKTTTETGKTQYASLVSSFLTKDTFGDFWDTNYSSLYVGTSEFATYANSWVVGTPVVLKSNIQDVISEQDELRIGSNKVVTEDVLQQKINDLSNGSLGNKYVSNSSTILGSDIYDALNAENITTLQDYLTTYFITRSDFNSKSVLTESNLNGYLKSQLESTEEDNLVTTFSTYMSNYLNREDCTLITTINLDDQDKIKKLEARIEALEKKIQALENSTPNPDGGTDIPGNGLNGVGEYSVAQAINYYKAGNTGVKNTTVCGYIVGVLNSQTSPSFSGTTTKNSNIIIADDPDETNINNCIPIELKSDTTARAELNLVDNGGKYKQPVKITGTLDSYFGMAGIKSVTDHSFI